MRVVPQESQRGPNQRPAKHGKFPDFRDVLNVEIGSPAKVAADVRKHRKGPRCNHRATDGQPVQAVGEIHGVRRAHNHQAHKDEEREKRQGPPIRCLHQSVNDKVRVNPLRKGNHQLRRVHVARQQRQQRAADNQADHNLKIDFFLRREPQVLLLRDLGVVIDETDDRESSQRKERDQNERIRQIRP